MSKYGKNMRFKAMRRAAVVAVAMVAVWFLAAGDASADCGHYVVILNPSATAKANQQAMTGHVRGQHGNSDSPKPCDGPQCRSRLPGSVPVAPPVTQTVTVDQHAMLAGEIEVNSPGFTSTTFESIVHLSPAHLLTAEPPPRG